MQETIEFILQQGVKLHTQLKHQYLVSILVLLKTFYDYILFFSIAIYMLVSEFDLIVF